RRGDDQARLTKQHEGKKRELEADCPDSHRTRQGGRGIDTERGNQPRPKPFRLRVGNQRTPEKPKVARPPDLPQPGNQIHRSHEEPYPAYRARVHYGVRRRISSMSSPLDQGVERPRVGASAERQEYGEPDDEMEVVRLAEALRDSEDIDGEDSREERGRSRE